MLFHAKNGQISLNNAITDYIRFGKGTKTLIILPGLGDGLRTVKGTALPMSFMYRKLAKEYTVYAFSRKHPLPKGHTTYDMALDLKAAMEALNITHASILGVSMGGMIAQHLAAGFPKVVDKLILTVTASKPNHTLTESIAEWSSYAKAGDHTAFMDSNVKRIFTDKYYQRNKWLIPIMGKLTKPKSYERFFIQAEACLNHNAYDQLEHISCPVLIIGGEQDRALSPDESRVLAEKLPHSTLHMYEEYGHGAYEESKDFEDIVLQFLRQP